ncbi:MAG TPA: ethylbenzene dehydrogenase-related protein [Candidatus Binatia bacterium]|nr:ethylbenzene dehydrogenase-related protein [Candidatus Binatia bacterium]
MPRRSTTRVGILIAVLPWLAISCGTKIATQPSPSDSVTSVAAPEEFLTSAQQEHRELLVDGRPTPIEWNITAPTYVVMSGIGGGGDFILGVHSLWSYDRFNTQQAIYFLFEWPDPSESRLEHPIINDSIDVFDDHGNQTFHCATSDIFTRPTSWHRSPLEEDQVVVEIFSNSSGSYPADNWRWGAGTTDPCFPTSVVEFQGASEDTVGSTQHPVAGFAEDRWDMGGGPVDDQGRLTYHDNFTQYSNGVVPDSVTSKGSRDTRLNRGKPTAYAIWQYVARPLDVCDSLGNWRLNPVRVDDSSVRDKSWNPGDYVPGVLLRFPTLSQTDVLARGAWGSGKWNLEIRRNLTTYDKRLDTTPDKTDPSRWIPWDDDLQLQPGRRYMMRVTVYDASSTRGSRSAMLPLYLKPR